MDPAGLEKEVTKEDQDKINKFGRLNTEMHELMETLKMKQEFLSAVQDAQGEAMEVEGDGAVKLFVGETFFDLTGDEAVDTLLKREQELETVVNELSSKITSIKSELDKLKAQLYSKFGRSAINLDED